MRVLKQNRLRFCSLLRCAVHRWQGVPGSVGVLLGETACVWHPLAARELLFSRTFAKAGYPYVHTAVLLGLWVQQSSYLAKHIKRKIQRMVQLIVLASSLFVRSTGACRLLLLCCRRIIETTAYIIVVVAERFRQHPRGALPPARCAYRLG